MKTDDLNNSENEELNETEDVENKNVETGEINSVDEKNEKEEKETDLETENVIANEVILDNEEVITSSIEKNSEEEKNDEKSEAEVKEEIVEDEKLEEKVEEETELEKEVKVEQEEVNEPEIIVEISKEETKGETENDEEEEKEETLEEEELVTVDEREEEEGVEQTKEVEIEDLDYSILSQEELVEQLKTLIDKENIPKTKDRIETIKVNFYKKHHAEIDELRNAFIEAGGNEEEFNPPINQLEEQFKVYYTIFKEKRAEYNVNLEKAKDGNLVLKYQIIDKIGELTTDQESLNKTFQEFKDLQKQWQEIGLVPQSEVKKLWDSYNYQIEKFYDYVKINKDLRDLDLKKNMELKIELCERAEELLMEPKIVSAFKELQKLHDRWREIGPVPIEKKDELWERFKQATSKINKKHQEYFETLKTEQINNLKAKTLLCEKVEEILSMGLNTPKAWEENAKEVIELQRLWKLIGFAPKKENNKIYERFRKACDAFFDSKRDFYSKNKEDEENNLQLKIELCLQAESMQDNTDWRKTTDFYIEIQKKWKTIGPVPRKHKDEIWQRFRKACNAFFDRKSGHFSSLDEEQDKNLEYKKELIDKLKNFELSEDNQANFKALNQIQKEWTSIGHIPIKQKDEITKEFRTLLDRIFEKLDLNENEKMKLQFRNKIEALKNSPKSYNRLRNERDKIISRMDKLKNNIVLWENNIGFFAKSKNAESMINDFKQKIERAKESVEMLEDQLNMIDDLL